MQAASHHSNFSKFARKKEKKDFFFTKDGLLAQILSFPHFSLDSLNNTSTHQHHHHHHHHYFSTSSFTP